MKKIYLSIPVFVICMMLFTVSCNDEFLNTAPLDKISSDATWGDAALSQAFIFNVYSFLGYGGYEEQALAAYTDEAMFTHAGRNINTFTEGSETPSNRAWMSSTYFWDNMYLAIRQANIALENLPNATFTDTALRDVLLGEAHFLRAYYYHQLMRFYGGVPIIDRAYGLDEDYAVNRNTFEETINFIVSDLDMSAALLSGAAMTEGRATELASLALKSRVLLYAASDLHDAGKARAIDEGLASDLLAYTGGSQDSRWQAAKAAAEAAVNAGSGYKLDLSGPVSAADGQQNYTSIAMGGGSAAGDAAAEVELIFQRTATTDYTVEDNWPLGGLHYGVNNGPNGYHNWAGNTPIQQLVDDYEMMDGSKFDWGNPAHASAPYTDRDPRFYATILYDGADWKPRPSDVTAIDPADQIQTGYYDDGAGNLINGIDTRESPIENWNGSRTHYYTRKFIDPDPAVVDGLSAAQVVPWPFIRYTEVVLNFIEAALETGDEASAVDWLNRIRFRAGMPATTASGSELMDLYRNERRLELVYEEHRYHDARRWLIADQTVGRGIKAINVVGMLKPGESPHVPYRHDKSKYEYTYTVFDNTENETRVWANKMYYRPIDRDEVNRNASLVQNPGY